MKRIPAFLLLTLLVLMSSISCDDYYEDNECTCPHGGVIGGWEEPDDTTSVSKNDTTGGFEVTLEEWGNTETHDISI